MHMSILIKLHQCLWTN